MNDTKIKIKLSKSIEIAGTSLQGVMPPDVTFEDLLDIFGEPTNTYQGHKVRVEWRGTVNGRVFTIYDYKCTEILLESLTGEYWHIGGCSPVVADDLIQYITEKLS